MWTLTSYLVATYLNPQKNGSETNLCQATPPITMLLSQSNQHLSIHQTPQQPKADRTKYPKTSRFTIGADLVHLLHQGDIEHQSCCKA